jgi:hypothetical protein
LRRKRQLVEEEEEEEEEAAAAVKVGEGVTEGGDEHKRYRAFRRRYMRELWASSASPPPSPPREYTLEEDLAVFRDAERQLRGACEAGNVTEAERLLACGAVFEEWDGCSEGTVMTLMRAMQRNERRESRETNKRFEVEESSGEADGLLASVLQDLELRQRAGASVAADSVYTEEHLPEEHEELSSKKEASLLLASGSNVGAQAPQAEEEEEGGGEEDVVEEAWREGGVWGEGRWGELPLERDEDVSLEGAPFLDCQVSGFRGQALWFRVWVLGFRAARERQ